jgi:hypothetical protein
LPLLHKFPKLFEKCPRYVRMGGNEMRLLIALVAAVAVLALAACS